MSMKNIVETAIMKYERHLSLIVFILFLGLFVSTVNGEHSGRL